MRGRRVALWLTVLVVGPPAALLTVLRLAQLDAGPAVRLVSFTPLALPLYGGLSLLLLVALARRRSPARLVATALVLVGLGLHAWWFAPMVVGGGPPAAPGGPRLVVMNANLFEGRADPAAVVDEVRGAGVDVLVVEEVTVEALGAMDRAGLDDLLPHRIGHPDGTVAGTMVLAREPLGEPEPVATGSQSWLVPLASGLTLMAVHPLAPVTPREWRADHATILAAVREAEPDLVVGDFNATLDHRPLQALEAVGLRDAAALADEGWQPTWPANGLTPVPGLALPALVQIDHVLVGPGLAALGTRTVEIAGTDHRAVVATLAPAAVP